MICFFLWCLFWFSSYLTSFCQLAKYSVCNLSSTFADYQRCEKMLFKLEIVSRIMELDFRLDRNKCYFDVISQINIRNTKPCYSFHLFSVVSFPLLSPTEWSLSVFFFIYFFMHLPNSSLFEPVEDVSHDSFVCAQVISLPQMYPVAELPF